MLIPGGSSSPRRMEVPVPSTLPRQAAAAALILALAGPLQAGSEHSLSGTIVRLQPTVQAGAVAEIAFDNRAVNSQYDDSSFALEMVGVVVEVTYRWNTNPAGDDEIVIQTDPGHIAVPRSLTVAEGQVGIAHIYPLESVGF